MSKRVRGQIHPRQGTLHGTARGGTAVTTPRAKKPRGRKPKFRVGEVVVFKESGELAKIRRLEIIASEIFPVYFLSGASYTPENYLRPLTVRERGGRP